MAETTLRSREDLLRWAEHEGVLDDSILVSWTDAPRSLTVALRILEDALGDRRESFRRTSERYQTFALIASKGGQMHATGAIGANAPFEGDVLEDDSGFGLELRCGDGSLRATATEWQARAGDEIVVPIERWIDLPEITFHGDGPVVVHALRAALGAPCGLYGNWNGSGQSFGAAFVRDVVAPLPLPNDEELGGAWRLVPGGVDATDPSGLWLTGNSSPTSAYVTLHRRAGTDRALVRSVSEALAALPGLSWAFSGNTLIEDAAAREAWCAAAYTE